MARTPKFQKIDVMTALQRNVFTALATVGLSMTGIFGVWWFLPSHLPHNFHGPLHAIDIILFLLVSYVVWYQITSEVFSWMIAKDMKRPRRMIPKAGQRVAFLTAFVPGKEPYDMLEETLSHMVNVDYPHDTWLLDEGNDKTAKQICRRLGVKHFSRKGIQKYNTNEGRFKKRTKAGNHNAWHDRNGRKYDIVAQIDVDFIPRKDFLTKTLGYFKDPEVSFVGIPQIYGNVEESWVADGAAQQSYNFAGNGQKGFFGKDMQLFIGANHIVRTAALKDIGGYTGHIVEDHLTGMKLYVNRWKSVYIAEKLAIGEGPATWDAFFSQQMRWAYGLIDILFKHSPKLLPKMKRQHAINYYILQQHYFYGLVQVIGIALLTLFYLFGIQATSMTLAPLLLLYVPLIIWQNIISLWLQQFNVDPKVESGLMLRGKIVTLAAWPIYFLALISVLTGKRLTYAVTPKGDKQSEHTPLDIFLPHAIIGTITAIDILAALATHRDAPFLLFWAVLNTIVMYGFVCYVVGQRARNYLATLTLAPITKLARATN
jgi:cellulose synthase/poly-beta-1,6-N-acetylglucosamine synthase-like glycosyltransferase